MKRLVIIAMILSIALVCIGSERIPTTFSIGQWNYNNEWLVWDDRGPSETSIQLFEIATRLGVDASGDGIQLFDILEAIVDRIEQLEKAQ